MEGGPGASLRHSRSPSLPEGRDTAVDPVVATHFMTRLISFLFLLTACGGGTPTANDAAPVDAHTVDGDALLQCGDTCNPEANAGCYPNSRCGTIVRDSPCLIDCVPLGTTPVGSACVRAADGTDDCVEKSACVDGLCRPFCDEIYVGCDAGTCDFFDGTDADWLGVCR